MGVYEVEESKMTMAGGAVTALAGGGILAAKVMHDLEGCTDGDCWKNLFDWYILGGIMLIGGILAAVLGYMGCKCRQCVYGKTEGAEVDMTNAVVGTAVVATVATFAATVANPLSIMDPA